MRKTKVIQSWTVRNHLGQYIGTYHAYTAEQAIARHVAADRSVGSAFRKSYRTSDTVADFTAKVENLR